MHRVISNELASVVGAMSYIITEGVFLDLGPNSILDFLRYLQISGRYTCPLGSQPQFAGSKQSE